MAELNARITAKASATAGETPQSADLEIAEIAVNTADGKFFTKHTDGTIKEISGGGAVDSVNGETGDVSLGIQDMDDFEYLPVGGASWELRHAGGSSPAPGFCYSSPSSSRFNYTDSNGNDTTAAFQTLQAGDLLLLAHYDAPGGNLVASYAATITSIPDPQPDPDYFEVAHEADNNMDNAPDGSHWVISNPGFAGSLPLAEGDILQWNNAEQKFKPAQLPAASAVESVNGETGVVSLGIQDMDDFEYNLGSNWYPYSTSTSTDQPGGINGGSNFVDIAVIDSNGVSHTFPAPPASLWVSMDNGSTWEEYAYTTSTFLVADVTVRFIGDTWSDPLESGTNAIVTFVDPVAFPDDTEPLVDGDILQWNNAEQKFKPVQLSSGGGNGGGISLATLKAEVAASTDFTDFQSRIAAL